MADPEGSTGSGSSGGWSGWGGGHGWGGRRRGGPTPRPPWGPPGEAFPPQGRPRPEAWRTMRGRFVRRAVLFLAIVIVLLSVVIALVIDLIGGLVSGRGSVVLVLVLALIALFLIGGWRRVRRAAAAVGDLIEAAERIE